MQLFVLKSISRSGYKCPDGSYKVYEHELGIFDSIEKAEAFMRMYIVKTKEWHTEFHCFIIFEKTLNRGLSKKRDSICNFEGVRTYLPDGTLFCDSPYDDACEKSFRGRPAETIKFKVGEIIWCWWGGRISPCLVTMLPMTDVYYQERVKQLGEELGLDFVDDAYTVYPCEGGHEHPKCWRCMPYYGKLSKRTFQRIQANKRKEEAELEQWKAAKKKENK